MNDPFVVDKEVLNPLYQYSQLIDSTIVTFANFLRLGLIFPHIGKNFTDSFSLSAVVNFTNILHEAFAPVSLCQKRTNLNCKYKKAAQKTFIQKSCS